MEKRKRELMYPVTISFRVTRKDKRLIKKACKQVGVNRSELFRNRFLKIINE